MSEEFTILKFKTVFFPGDKSDIVANFDAQVGDFRIRKAQIRKSRESGTLWMNMRGAGDGYGISLAHGTVRDALQSAAIALYREEIET